MRRTFSLAFKLRKPTDRVTGPTARQMNASGDMTGPEDIAQQFDVEKGRRSSSDAGSSSDAHVSLNNVVAPLPAATAPGAPDFAKRQKACSSDGAGWWVAKTF